MALEKKYVGTFIWSSRGVEGFLFDKGLNYLHEQRCEPKIEMQIAYLVDIFSHLNHLNLQLQSSGNVELEGSANIFVFEDKLRAFVCKINL